MLVEGGFAEALEIYSKIQILLHLHVPNDLDLLTNFITSFVIKKNKPISICEKLFNLINS